MGCGVRGTSLNHQFLGRPCCNEDDAPRLGLNLLMGTTAAEKSKNIVRNLKEDRIRVVQGIFRREN